MAALAWPSSGGAATVDFECPAVLAEHRRFASIRLSPNRKDDAFGMLLRAQSLDALEQRTADANQRRPFLDRHFVILAHAHRQMFERVRRTDR